MIKGINEREEIKKIIEEAINVGVKCYKMGPKSSQTLKRSSEVKNKRKEKNERRPNPGVNSRKKPKV